MCFLAKWLLQPRQLGMTMGTISPIHYMHYGYLIASSMMGTIFYTIWFGCSLINLSMLLLPRCVGWIAQHFECLESRKIGPVQSHKYRCFLSMVVYSTT
jgi:hypothetical protein